MTGRSGRPSGEREGARVTLLVARGELAAADLEIAGDAYRHLFRARRLASGARLRLVDGEGGARWGTVVEVGRDGARVELGGEAPANEPRARLEVLAAPPKPPRAAWLVEKATERVAAAAVEQCHRSRRPAVTGVHPASELARLVAGLEPLWVLDPGASRPLEALAAGARGGVLVGPEGGWTEAERRRLGELGAGAAGLGATVLRLETAAVAAVALALVAGEPR